MEPIHRFDPHEPYPIAPYPDERPLKVTNLADEWDWQTLEGIKRELCTVETTWHSAGGLISS